jgi:DNA/RNA-binding domain of Phe-tRNA-synthetase-like protein
VNIATHPLRFSYATTIRAEFPELRTALLRLDGVTRDADVTSWTERHADVAKARLAGETEAALPEIQAWRRAYARMGLKPTQYRCASEALLRRFRKEGSLPRIHPLVDLCNAVSIAFAIPIAVFDVDKVAGDLEVRRAGGHERYLTFGGEIESPDAGEVIFADSSDSVHARRWVNRQSGLSAVRDETARALVVVEAMHEGGADDVARLAAALHNAAAEAWPRAAIADGQAG